MTPHKIEQVSAHSFPSFFSHAQFPFFDVCFNLCQEKKCFDGRSRKAWRFYFKSFLDATTRVKKRENTVAEKNKDSFVPIFSLGQKREIRFLLHVLLICKLNQSHQKKGFFPRAFLWIEKVSFFFSLARRRRRGILELQEMPPL